MGNYNSDQKNARFYGLKLAKNTDADIISKLDRVPSIQGYIKNLIRNDITMEETTMKRRYHILPEYLSNWGEDTTENTIITQDEVEQLAADWGTPIEELLAQLTETDAARISIDNGESYTSPEEALQAVPFETIVHYMDDDARETVHQDGPETELAFLRRYLEIAPCDLIIG